MLLKNNTFPEIISAPEADYLFVKTSGIENAGLGLFTAINMFNGMAIMKIIRNRYRSFLFIIKEEIANDFILTNFDWFDGLLSLTVIIDLINLS
jgi:xylose isomerase